VTVKDHFWRWLYVPLTELTQWLARWAATMQQGRIAVYLLYSFLSPCSPRWWW
jgi:hydrogenase-4 component B